MTPTNELRFFERETGRTCMNEWGYHYREIVQVLQQKWVDDQLCSLNANYSEWRDVPVVREDV